MHYLLRADESLTFIGARWNGIRQHLLYCGSGIESYRIYTRVRQGMYMY